MTHGLGYIQIDVGVRAVCISLLAHADWEPFLTNQESGKGAVFRFKLSSQRIWD